MKELYTAGELAKLIGVSYKTIRYYYEKGMIVPVHVMEAGYRMYDRDTVEILQRIMMLKYLDFSLQEIKQILKEENPKETFRRQREMLIAQKDHLEQVLGAVEEIENIPSGEQWDKLLQIIQMTTQKEEIVKQYKKGENLQKRIDIHVYSTAKMDWYDWILEKSQIGEGMKILEIGCGNGRFWTTVSEKLPENLQVFMTDSSEGMLQEAKKQIEARREIFERKKIKFVFEQKDAEDFRMEENGFDCIMANHMLYHVSNKKRPILFQTCFELLKKQGIFFATTVGKTHFQQLFELLTEFDKQIERPDWISKNFELENGEEQLKKYFVQVCMEEQENDLLVPKAQAVYDYVNSLPGNVKKIVAERQESFKCYLEKKILPESPMFIHKSQGAVWGRK